jgi:hypothetical protein
MLIESGLKNINVVLCICAIIISALLFPSARKRGAGAVWNEFFRWTILFPGGILSVQTFVMHAFFPDLSARLIGWLPSPFQFEVAIANLAIGICCIISFKASFGYRLASDTALTVWLWGDAVGHIRQMIVNNNYSPGNAGSWFWTDVILPPVIIFFLLMAKSKSKKLS